MILSLNINTLLALIGIIAVASTLLGLFSVCWVTRTRGSLPNHTPSVTIYKPLKGLDEDLESNLRSFFVLDYPCYQLLFGVAEDSDPAVQVVRRLMAEYSRQDARLVIANQPFGLNPKVENLAAMEPFRKHDVILISDSNVRVRSNYLRETVCYLADPSVGLVSNLFVGVEEQQTGAVLENLQLNGFVAGGVASAAFLGVTCVVGKSMLMPVSVLDAAGGFQGVRNVLAEDQVLGIRVRKAGYRTRLSHHVVENVNQVRGVKWFLNRHSRWFKIRRQLAFGPFLAEPLANLTAVGLVLALAEKSGIAWWGLFFLVGLGLFRDAFQSYWLRGRVPRMRHLLLTPVKDLLLLPVWFDALFDNRVQWRGNRLKIGRYTRLHRESVRLDAKRRVRRRRRFRA